MVANTAAAESDSVLDSANNAKTTKNAVETDAEITDTTYAETTQNAIETADDSDSDSENAEN